MKEEIQKNIKIMADDALRTIGIAYKPYSEDTCDLSDAKKNKLGVYDEETKGFILCGIFGIADSIRPEVPNAVRICQSAGIKVRMVTGDNKDTARAIAKKAYIVESDQDTVIEGPEFIK